MRALLLFALILTSGLARAASWEIGIVFLGAQDDDEYQADMDRNIIDLTRLVPGAGLRLTLYREFAKRAVQFTPDLKGAKLHDWRALFNKMPVKVEVPGEMQEWNRADGDASVLSD